MTTFDIGGRRIGEGVFIIAEAGVNHDGRLDRALALVDAAAAAGADCVKFQTWSTARMLTRAAPKADYQRETTGAAESQYEMILRLELDEAIFRAIAVRAAERKIVFLSSPFDESSSDLLADLGVPAFKLGSGELTNHGLIEHVARKARPVILSTGMATLAEVDEAVRVFRRAGGDRLALLHCVSNYPADPSDANLRAMHTLATAFAVPVGFSDHTPGDEISLAAVALGACVIEKHLTLDRTLPGPDHRASHDPAMFSGLVRSIRLVQAALGDGVKQPRPSERNVAEVARKSLVAARDIPAGATIERADVCAKRPGTGLPPSLLSLVIGRTARVAMPADTLIRLEMLS